MNRPCQSVCLTQQWDRRFHCLNPLLLWYYVRNTFGILLYGRESGSCSPLGVNSCAKHGLKTNISKLSPTERIGNLLVSSCNEQREPPEVAVGT
jgi:hypothetical protein